MKRKTVEDVFEFTHWDSKIVLSARCNPSLGQRVADDAKSLGLNVSQTIEIRLANYYEKKDKEETLDILDKNAVAAASPISELQDMYNEQHEQNELLRKQNSVLVEQTAHLSDPVFLKLFEQFKGRTEQILTSSGEIISITYNTETDLLKAMIYTVIYKP